MAGDKIYIGNGKEHIFQDVGKEIKLRIDISNFRKYHEKYGFTTDAGKKMLTLIVNERREKDQYGNTHSVRIDTWKPDGGRQDDKPAAQSGQASDDGFTDDIPF